MIKFRKLFARPLENKSEFAIISYAKYPYVMKIKTKNAYFTLDFAEEPHKEQYVAQYRKILKIDLWLCVIGREWLTKEITK
jgi:hypothetical protein